MTFTLPELPFKLEDLEPHISKETIEYHYEKHHRGYVDTLNKLTADTTWENKQLLEIVRGSTGALFNAAAQNWNHSFYWECMKKPGPQKAVVLDIQKPIEQTFGSKNEFKKIFEEKAIKLFGSGWVWLVISDKNKLSIETSNNANTPVQESGLAPLLVCDVWEHAYYIDYRNDRKKYFDAWWKCVDQIKVNQRYKSAVDLFNLEKYHA